MCLYECAECKWNSLRPLRFRWLCKQTVNNVTQLDNDANNLEVRKEETCGKGSVRVAKR